MNPITIAMPAWVAYTVVIGLILCIVMILFYCLCALKRSLTKQPGSLLDFWSKPYDPAIENAFQLLINVLDHPKIEIINFEGTISVSLFNTPYSLFGTTKVVHTIVFITGVMSAKRCQYRTYKIAKRKYYELVSRTSIADIPNARRDDQGNVVILKDHQ